MKAESPRSRVESLKLEILDLNKRLPVSSKSRPLYESLPLQVKIENPTEARKAELLSQLALLKQRTEGKLAPLKAKIKSLEAEETTIVQEIEYEKTAIDSQKQELEGKLQHQQGLLRVLQHQFEELQQTQSAVQSKWEFQYQSTSEEFDLKIKPLETRLEGVWKALSESESERLKLSEESQSVEECMGMCVEEMDMVTLQRAEFVAHREEMEELYDDLKRKYGKDISDFISGAESKHAACKLKDRKNALIDKVKSAEVSLEANNAAMKSTQDRYQAVHSHLHSLVSAAPNVKTQQDLEKLETLIKLKTPDFTQLLEEAVLDINAVNGFDVDEWILRQQMREVDSFLVKMESDTQREQTRLQQEAVDLTEELERCDATGRSETVEKDRGGEEYVRDLKRRLFNLTNAQQQLARQYQRRRAAVEQWRSEASQLLSQTPISSEVKASDELILDDFKSRAHFLGNLDPLLSQYLVKLRERERYLQANQGTVAQLQSELSEIKGRGEGLKLEKEQLQRERTKLRQELTKFIMEEKRLAKRGDDHMADAVRSTQSLKVGKRIEEILGKVDYWEDRIEACNRTLTELSNEYRKSEGRKDELPSSVAQLSEKFAGLKEKETELLSAIAGLLERKKAALVEILDKLTLGLSSPAQTAKEKALLSQVNQIAPLIDSYRGQLKLLSYDNSQALRVLAQRLADTQTALTRANSELAELEAEVEKTQMVEAQLAEIDEPKGNSVLYRSGRRHLQQSELPDMSLRSSRSTSQQRTATKRSCQSNSPTRQGFVDSHSSIYSHLASEADQSADNIDLSIARGIQLVNELPSSGDSLAAVKGKMKKYFRLEDATTQEQVFFEKVQQILEGTDLYKKFTQRQFLKQKPFDPLNSKETPPEACGYGIRNLRLSANLSQLEVRHPMKPGVDSSLLVDQILSPVLPQITITVLKHQKKLLNSESFIEEAMTLATGREGVDKEYSEMRESGFINVNSEAFQEKCRTCSMYPFSIALQQGGRVELIARSYTVFKAWVTGLNTLVKYKKQLPRLRQKIETYTTTVS